MQQGNPFNLRIQIYQTSALSTPVSGNPATKPPLETARRCKPLYLLQLIELSLLHSSPWRWRRLPAPRTTLARAVISLCLGAMMMVMMLMLTLMMLMLVVMIPGIMTAGCRGLLHLSAGRSARSLYSTL